MVQNLENRLWNDNSIVTAFNIFNPCPISLDRLQNDLQSYGNQNVMELFDFYSKGIELNAENLLSEWDLFKYNYMNAAIINQLPTWRQLVSIGCQNSDLFPNLSKLCHILNCFNAQNATVERGFSLMNRLCTKNRNKITPRVLEILMRLRLSTAEYSNFHYGPAIKEYFKNTIYSLGLKVDRKQKNLSQSLDATESIENEDYSAFTSLEEF